jgi:signal recognition particle subunit SEC65
MQNLNIVDVLRKSQYDGTPCQNWDWPRYTWDTEYGLILVKK